MKNTTVRLGLALALTLGLSACASAPEPGTSTDTEPGSPLKAVATTTQICDYLTQISHHAEEALDLTCLLAPNASAHEHEMTPQQMQALSQADYLFLNGVDLEHFLDNAIESSGFQGTSVDTSRGVDVRPWPFPGEDGEAPEFTHDPHIWTSPKNAKIQVHNIVDALAQDDPSWRQAGEHYLQQLKDLDSWVGTSMASVPKAKRVLFTSHDAFGYFSQDYDVTFIGSALSDFNNQQDATSAHIEAAATQVRESGATAIFAENSNNSKSIEAIARAAGVRAITDSDALYGDSLGVPGSQGETYIGSILHNVSTLLKAWGGEPAPIPVGLDATR
ncbi:metal ABC transporter substrate-binding protein [Corynebacterium sp.]|uniref:metal ABC transporter substrate-binding protein n=1 Tax=Corynebacterium sp. TaxID=1720 RepID=UPI0026DB99B3|nr:metal ABC transporter substrate-binding protein [Corynebacterium sp.]MDO5032395.1 metal ABC transporter substrate-binding protein [Corynebacterium sp.]